jgi:hypothetical protein
MPNIYYCQSINRGSGILRAVLSWEEGAKLLKLQPAQYAGQQFPATIPGQTVDFAVMSILEAEPNEEWRAGFYRFDADLAQIEEAVQSCTAKLAVVGASQSKSTTPQTTKP